MRDELRTVNRVLGIEPKIGSFSLYQILPIGALGFAVIYGAVAAGLNWGVALALWGILSAFYLIVMGDKPWLTLSRLYVPPTLIRAGVLFRPLTRERQLCWRQGAGGKLKTLTSTKR